MKHLISFFLLICFTSYGQVRQVLGQYMLHPQTYNPGYSDPDTKFSVNGIYKKQWVSQNNFPDAGIIYGHYNFNETHGAGLMISNDLMNSVNHFELAANYVYNIPIFSEANLGLGFKLAFCEQNLLKPNLIYFDPEPLLDGGQTFTYINAGAGLSITSPTFNFHFSAPYFFGNRYLNSNDVYTFKYNHLYMNIGYKFRNDDWFIFYPTALVTAVEGAQLRATVNSNFLFSQLVWTGVGVSSDLTLSFMAGIFAMGGLRVTYGFEHSYFTKHNSTGVTHEVSLNYAKTINNNPFNKKKMKRITNTRYRRR
jgi:type IX secretion system PorP/SprF family membrane protein